MTCLAWAHLGDTASALDGLRRHEPLAEAWTAEQQQLAFQSMLRALKQKASNDTAFQITQRVWMIAASNNLPDRHLQLHDFVMALLRKGRLPAAHQVNLLLRSCSKQHLHEASGHRWCKSLCVYMGYPSLRASVLCANPSRLTVAACPEELSHSLIARCFLYLLWI